MSVALVTGASRGLGRALAGELAARGWDLVLSARGAPALEEAAAVLAEAAGVRVAAVAGDVSSGAHRAALVVAARGLGGLDLLVNNAGVLGAEPLVPLAVHDLAGLREAFEVNVVGPLGLVQEGLALLRASEAGAVLNISSDAAVVAYATWGAYGATKAAGDLMSAVLAVEEPGLRVWWADPGSMRTRMMAAAEPGEDLAGLPAPEEVAPALLRLVAERLPNGRYTAEGLGGGGAAGEGGRVGSDGGGPLAAPDGEAGGTAGGTVSGAAAGPPGDTAGAVGGTAGSALGSTAGAVGGTAGSALGSTAGAVGGTAGSPTGSTAGTGGAAGSGGVR
ncbi:SDR family NAD(P)-dependent oxidoreductase [Streptomyces sp. ISL-94]|nr:SDR family NAD(P)-dependent oxidoreductase [Streptomyces sp. ISL-94]